MVDMDRPWDQLESSLIISWDSQRLHLVSNCQLQTFHSSVCSTQLIIFTCSDNHASPLQDPSQRDYPQRHVIATILAK